MTGDFFSHYRSHRYSLSMTSVLTSDYLQLSTISLHMFYKTY